MKYLVGKNKYGQYCVPISSKHTQAARRILQGKVYEPRTIEFVTQVCDGGGIVHAGTYFGDFLPAYSRAASNVWAFEPNRENYECALCTIEQNNLTNVYLEHAALSDELSGQGRLQTKSSLGNAMGGGNRILSADEEVSDELIETVPLTTIDGHVGIVDVSVIQLDVEGHETEALAGGLETIRQYLPVIIVETLPPDTWLEQHLYPLGYEVQGKVSHNTILRVAGK